MNFLRKIKNNILGDGGGDNVDIGTIAKKELRENLDVVESLRKYDAGEKDIQTRNVERRLRDIRTTS